MTKIKAQVIGITRPPSCFCVKVVSLMCCFTSLNLLLSGSLSGLLPLKAHVHGGNRVTTKEDSNLLERLRNSLNRGGREGEIVQSAIILIKECLFETAVVFMQGSRRQY